MRYDPAARLRSTHVDGTPFSMNIWILHKRIGHTPTTAQRVFAAHLMEGLIVEFHERITLIHLHTFAAGKYLRGI